MDELQREKEAGFDFEYLLEALPKKEEIGDRYQTPGFGLAAQLFCSTAKFVLERLGETEGRGLLKKAVEYFGRERGRRIAERVRSLGLPLTFRNWLIYGDIDANRNFAAQPDLDQGDLMVRVENCTFYQAAREWGLEELAGLYCRYVDYAILEGYNPDIKLRLENRGQTGKDHCVFRYIMKESNK
jgi:hypothetical protein